MPIRLWKSSCYKNCSISQWSRFTNQPNVQFSKRHYVMQILPTIHRSISHNDPPLKRHQRPCASWWHPFISVPAQLQLIRIAKCVIRSAFCSCVIPIAPGTEVNPRGIGNIPRVVCNWVKTLPSLGGELLVCTIVKSCKLNRLNYSFTSRNEISLIGASCFEGRILEAACVCMG